MSMFNEMMMLAVGLPFCLRVLLIYYHEQIYSYLREVFFIKLVFHYKYNEKIMGDDVTQLPS